MEEKDIVDVIDYSDLGFHSYLLHYCGCSGTRMLCTVVILFGLLGGEMRRRGLVKGFNLQVQLFVAPRSYRVS
ncbi:MAG: hypothetical protein EZS28_023396 [Streblomastix strix]|uniref:Transmembrane protein n=1 Tax=Streblomastix strix TaxID=222440 RepID=A0A5J4VFC4_9EUKA|nr:MAG: hypothetical protein EZS28_023396 [Streblomastix strix]